MIVLPYIQIARVRVDGVSVTFTYRATDPKVKQVNLAGTFNGWSKDHDSMKVGPDGKTWTTSLVIPYGVIQYKFVLNGDDWIVDPNGHNVPDGNGHTNSEMTVMPPDYGKPASPSDGIIAKSALLHEPVEPQLNYDRGSLQIKFRARAGDLSSVDLIENGVRIPMTDTAHDDLYEYYKASFPWNRKSNVSYDFALHDGSRTAYYSPSGLSDSAPTRFELDAKTYHPFLVPDWPSRSVVYQIFPDRFADGDLQNDPKNVQPFGAKPTFSNRFGGDAVGVEQHIGYLKALGVGTVYFNPVFQSPSNHRYDTTDYRKIDPEFGTNKEFDDMTKALKASGIRTVMDFAFNHTATNFFAFEDVKKNGKSSPYVPWYFVKSYPVTVKENPPYVAWYGYPSMPKLNVVNPETEKYILDSVDYWISNAALAGVRLDVANEVDPKLWRDLRIHEKEKLPNFWIVGEEWGDANPWLHGDQWDSTMGYQFREACLGFFANGTTSPTEFLNQLQTVYESYPPQVSRNLMNLIGSHDTPRFLNLCNGDKNKLKLAATVLLTWPGAPSIYYGDELGMEGGADPDNRRTMEWQIANDANSTLAFYKKLIRARNSSQALQEGDPVKLVVDDQKKCFAFARETETDFAITAINNSSETQTISIPVPRKKGFQTLVDSLTGKSYPIADEISLTLPPEGCAVLLPSKA